MEENVEKKEAKKSKKKVIITVVVIVILILLVVGGFVFYHGNQIGKLIAEVNKLAEIEMINEDGTLKEEPIDMQIKTNGSYAVVEKTFKNYMNEIVTDTQELVNTLDQEKIMNLVSIDNMKEDGPDFTKSKEEITTMKNAISSYVTKMETLANEENLLSRIDDKDVGEYYKELYRQLAIDEESGANLKDTIDELKTNEEVAVQALNDLESIFNFLSDNKDEWQIEEEQIVFTTQSAYNEYTSLMSSLETM